MGKTTRKQPDWIREDDRWMRKGGKHSKPSRRSEKQNLEKEIDEVLKK